jgi:hypothetical protein
MTAFRIVSAAVALGLGVAAGTGSALGRERAAWTDDVAVSAGRARALQECSALANKFVEYSWGHAQSDHFRACMTQHGQPE